MEKTNIGLKWSQSNKPLGPFDRPSLLNHGACSLESRSFSFLVPYRNMRNKKGDVLVLYSFTFRPLDYKNRIERIVGLLD